MRERERKRVTLSCDSGSNIPSSYVASLEVDSMSSRTYKVISVCVCVCVCEREKETERAIKKDRVSKMQNITYP